MIKAQSVQESNTGDIWRNIKLYYDFNQNIALLPLNS
jgi:hypothetical protein